MSDSDRPLRGASGWGWKSAVAVGLIGFVATLTALVFFAFMVLSRGSLAEREAQQCEQNLHRIGLALEAYETRNKSYPPAQLRDSPSGPVRSWRVALLDFLGDTKLEGKYDPKQPWDSPANESLREPTPEVFACPCDPARWTGETSYLGCVDPTTGQLGFRPAGWNAPEIDPKLKIVLIELPGSGVGWLEPHDLVAGDPETAKLADRPLLVSHFGEGHVLLDDGTVTRLSTERLQALLHSLAGR
jgi:uncharacterized protein DUF1559